MRIRKKADSLDGNNIFWITIADLMTALVLVFIVLFIYAYTRNNIEQYKVNVQKQKSLENLEQSLRKNNINANVDLSTGVVKISNLELFDLNSYELSDKGKEYLTKFSPAYLDSIFLNEQLKDNVDKIIIQGHTDSQTFKGKYSADEQYMKNMELSLKRAYSVAKFMTNTPYNKENMQKLHKMIIVEGASYSTPVTENGKENFEKSRRVELKLVIKPAKTN